VNGIISIFVKPNVFLSSRQKYFYSNIRMNKLILILAFISGILSFSQIEAVGIMPVGDQNGYTVKFGDSYHNYAKGNRVRIGISFKNQTNKLADVSQELIVFKYQ